MKSAKLTDIVEILGLEVVNAGSKYQTTTLDIGDINRPGLQLAGYMDRYPYKRLQVIGIVEHNYYMELPSAIRFERFQNFFSYPIPALIFARGLEIEEDILELAREMDITVLRSSLITTKLTSRLSGVIEDLLADQISLHGVMVDVYGQGVLLIGQSSIGKSETALDLVNRGHRLIADDRVLISKTDTGLVGTSPENIRHFMEIRGIGILNIRRLYGIRSVKTRGHLDLAVVMEPWDSEKEYERLGLDETYMTILGVKVPKVILPVKAGRNLAMIVELAAMNQRQKSFGINAAEELHEKLMAEHERKKNLD